MFGSSTELGNNSHEDYSPWLVTQYDMWQENWKVSDRAIAEALGRPQRTFADQMKRYRTELQRIQGF